MDVFEESLEGLGIEVKFNEHDVFSCELAKDDDGDKESLFLSAYRDTEEVSLRISVMTRNPLPQTPSPEFFTEFSEMALEPLRGGIGAGAASGSKNMVLYKVVPLAGTSPDHVMQTIESLVEAVEEWDMKLAGTLPNAPADSDIDGQHTANKAMEFIPRA